MTAASCSGHLLSAETKTLPRPLIPFTCSAWALLLTNSDTIKVSLVRVNINYPHSTENNNTFRRGKFGCGGEAVEGGGEWRIGHYQNRFPTALNFQHF